MSTASEETKPIDYAGKVVAVTGGARGIGRAMAEAFAKQGAKIAIADIEGAEQAGEEVGGFGMRVDVTKEDDIAAFVSATEERLGPIDVYVSNAGILRLDAPTWDAAGADDAAWFLSFDVNVMGSVRAARVLMPKMRERGAGVFVIVASAAGLCAQIGASSYSASKHAVVAFAESLNITHGDDGIQVVCVCPQAVRTPMLGGHDDGSVAGLDGVVEPSHVAEVTLKAIEEKQFLALPHPQVKDYEGFRAADRDRWLSSMRKLRRGLVDENGQPK